MSWLIFLVKTFEGFVQFDYKLCKITKTSNHGSNLYLPINLNSKHIFL